NRNRSVEWAERAVTESEAFTADEARAHGLIDVIAPDRDTLLAALHGRTITRFDGTRTTLHVRDTEVQRVERTFAERLLTVIADPQVAYLLLMAGAIALLIELTSPGLVVPGVAGALSLLLGLYGMSVLPVSAVGALLIAAAFGLFVAEVFVTSYGLLATAGIASFVVGSLILVDAPVPELRIGPEVIVPVAVVLAGFTALLAIRAVRSRRLRPRSGVEAMIGELGQVVVGIAPDQEGKVFVHGEYWTATATCALPEGTKVRVQALDGLRLHVVPAHVPTQGVTP
ncbi:MAG TPA: NfeD family protein, partial [Kofleriaceae bacterium]